MIISKKYKFLTLNPQKCGSGTKEICLREFSDVNVLHGTHWGDNILPLNLKNPRHGSVKDLKVVCGKLNIKYEEMFKFIIVRNPWDRFLSWYLDDCYRTKIKPSKKDFNNFILSNKRLTLSQYLKDENGELFFDHIGKLEEIQKELVSLFKKVNINNIPKIVHLEKTKEGQKKKFYKEKETKSLKQEFYSKASIDHVSKIEKDLLNIIDYKFDV